MGLNPKESPRRDQPRGLAEDRFESPEGGQGIRADSTAAALRAQRQAPPALAAEPPEEHQHQDRDDDDHGGYDQYGHGDGSGGERTPGLGDVGVAEELEVGGRSSPDPEQQLRARRRKRSQELARRLCDAGADFDEARFLRRVRRAFQRVQDAWSQQDLSPVRAFLSARPFLER